LSGSRPVHHVPRGPIAPGATVSTIPPLAAQRVPLLRLAAQRLLACMAAGPRTGACAAEVRQLPSTRTAPGPRCPPHSPGRGILQLPPRPGLGLGGAPAPAPTPAPANVQHLHRKRRSHLLDCGACRRHALGEHREGHDAQWPNKLCAKRRGANPEIILNFVGRGARATLFIFWSISIRCLVEMVRGPARRESRGSSATRGAGHVQCSAARILLVQTADAPASGDEVQPLEKEHAHALCVRAALRGTPRSAADRRPACHCCGRLTCCPMRRWPTLTRPLTRSTRRRKAKFRPTTSSPSSRR
jgi:hypothetical protein